MSEDNKRTPNADNPIKKGRIKRFLKRFVMLFLNPRFLLCFGIAWIITNGWSYIMMVLGVVFDVGWMIAVSGVYLAFLWLPVSPEKLVTFAIAIFLIKMIFPNDEHTLGTLRSLYEKARKSISKRKNTDKRG